jgi:hypothetical protein
MTRWAKGAAQAARVAVRDPRHAHMLQCEGTWFVGLDVLDNDAAGAVAGGAPIAGAAVDFIRDHHGGWPDLHRAQVSVVYPGYPRPRSGESDAAFAFRRDRDAAHVDGLIGEGHPKRRYLREPHQFILGIVLTDNPPDAAPLVVWKGSHKMMQQTFAAAGAPGDLDQLDLTDCYQETRRQAFSLCPRLPLTGPPGTAILLHRHLLHGVAPWAAGAGHSAQGRMIAYFRPLCPGGAAQWGADW